MAYAIMRTAKLKTGGNVGASLSHTYRERETQNADLEKTPQNEIIVKGDMDKMETMLDGVKKRSDSVQCVEVFMGTSPEFFEGKSESQISEWKDKSMGWAKETFGEENILSAVMHRDEQTPHLSVHVVPIKDGKLNAKSWLGGREKLSELQDSYFKSVEGLGLDRGERGSPAKHEEVKKYYERVQEPITIEGVQLTYPDHSTSDRLNMESFAKKVARSVRDQMNQKVVLPLLTKIKELEKPDLQRQRKNFRKMKKEIMGHEKELAEKESMVRLSDRKVKFAEERLKNSSNAIEKDRDHWKDRAESLETSVKMVLPEGDQVRQQIFQQREKLRKEKQLQFEKIHGKRNEGIEM